MNTAMRLLYGTFLRALLEIEYYALWAQGSMDVRSPSGYLNAPSPGVPEVFFHPAPSGTLVNLLDALHYRYISSRPSLYYMTADMSVPFLVAFVDTGARLLIENFLE